jgi:hypothetical protein
MFHKTRRAFIYIENRATRLAAEIGVDPEEYPVVRVAVPGRTPNPVWLEGDGVVFLVLSPHGGRESVYNGQGGRGEGEEGDEC